MTGHLPKRSGGTRPNRRRARAAGTRRRRHPRQQRRRHDDGALRFRPARGAPAHGRDQPARRDDGNGGLPRPAPRQCGGDLVTRLLGRRSGRTGWLAAYAATKWGINGWSEALRVELQPDVRVIVIEPGATAKELPDHITHAASKRVSKALDWSIPPHDIADVIAFAVSRPQRVTLNEILVRPTVQTM